MEDMKVKQTCKLPAGHARLLLTYSIIDCDTGLEIGPKDEKSNGTWDSNPNHMQLSTEMESFIDECVGNVHISNSTFEITFTDNRDYVRYKMTEFPERWPF